MTDGALDRWYVSGPLGVGTTFDEQLDAHSAASIPWSSLGSLMRHSGWETFNLLDARAAGPNQGPNLNLWGLNAAGKAVRLGLITSRFASTADGAASGYLAFHTKAPGRDVAEGLRISENGAVGVGTTTPQSRLQVKSLTAIDEGATGAGAWTNIGSNAFYDGTWKRVDGSKAGVNLHMNADGGGQEFRFLRAEANGNLRSIATLGTGLSFILEGNVGIGTTSPGAKLDVSGSGASQCCAPVPPTIALSENSAGVGRRAWLQFHNAGEAEAYIRLAGGGPAGSGREGPRRFEIGDSQGQGTGLTVAGDMRLGAAKTISAPGRLHIAGDELLYVLNRNGMVIGREWGGNGNLSVQGEVFLRMTRTSISGFDGGGRLGYHWIRTDGDDNELWLAYAQAWVNRPDIPRRVEFAVPVWAPVVRQTSDARLKADVRALGDVLPKLETIRGVSFIRRSVDGGSETSDRRDIGVIAQEIEPVFPELVSGGAENHYQAVDYSGLVGVLVEAVKELSAKNTVLERRVSGLEQQRRSRAR